MLFYHQLPHTGILDLATWHGGAAVTDSSGKWTMQKFKEVPVGKSVVDCWASMPAQMQALCSKGHTCDVRCHLQN